MVEVRCKKCNKLLYKTFPDRFGSFEDELSKSIDIDNISKVNGNIECQCPRCKEMNTNKI